MGDQDGPRLRGRARRDENDVRHDHLHRHKRGSEDVEVSVSPFRPFADRPFNGVGFEGQRYEEVVIVVVNQSSFACRIQFRECQVPRSSALSRLSGIRNESCRINTSTKNPNHKYKNKIQTGSNPTPSTTRMSASFSQLGAKERAAW